MAKYCNYDLSDIITHVQYVKQNYQALYKRGTCTWQGKTRNGKNVLLTKDWFETNIEYGQSWWYCTTVQMDLKK